MEGTFTKEETEALYQSIINSRSGIPRDNRELWIRAFQLYNTKSGLSRLGMGCPNCYYKVLLFIYKINA